MIHLYLDLVPTSFASTIEIIEAADARHMPDEPSTLANLEEAVWGVMRECETMPDFSSIYMKVVNDRGEDLLQSLMPHANVNFDSDGTITIDGAEIDSIEAFNDIYDNYHAEQAQQYDEDEEDEDYADWN